jgi:dihydroorotate dehydrogenase
MLPYGYRSGDAAVVVDGLRYHTPVALAAGFDYNGRLTRILPSVGFGGVEVGSVTARPTPGNPGPRLRRLVRSNSLVVNKGLRNDGLERIIASEYSRWRVTSVKRGRQFGHRAGRRDKSLPPLAAYAGYIHGIPGTGKAGDPL